MLIWGTGMGGMVLSSNARAAFAQLGWYGLPGGPAPAAMRVLNTNPYGGNTLELDGSSVSGNQTQASKLLPNGATAQTFFIGARMYVPSGMGLLLGPGIAVGHTGTMQLSLAMRDFGQIELWQGRKHYSGAVLLATSDPGAYLEDTWNYIELSGFLSNTSAGHAEVRVNTKVVISVVSAITNLVAANAPANSYMVFEQEDPGAGFSFSNCQWTDCYFNDDQGGKNNSYIGNVRVPALITAGAGASTQFTPFGAGTNWQAAQNTAIDDTKYVFDITVGDLDLYTITPLLNSPAIFGVQVTGFYRQDDATQRSAANVILSNATQAQGNDFFMGANYAAQTDMFENDPDTGTTWLYTAVNAMQMGPKVTS